MRLEICLQTNFYLVFVISLQILPTYNFIFLVIFHSIQSDSSWMSYLRLLVALKGCGSFFAILKNDFFRNSPCIKVLKIWLVLLMLLHVTVAEEMKGTEM